MGALPIRGMMHLAANKSKKMDHSKAMRRQELTALVGSMFERMDEALRLF